MKTISESEKVKSLPVLFDNLSDGYVDYRRKHQRKDYEDLLRWIELHGWTVEDGSCYFHAKCPCGTHQRWIPLTPSGARTLENLEMWFRRQTCWED